jgi:plasmid stabilization system protein ParE
MADRLRFHPLVAQDLHDAIDWYDNISVELGNRFRTLVNDRFDEIERMPSSFAIAFDEIQFARIRKFPHIVLFHRIGEIVQVLGVFHGASDPEKWRQRVE